MTERERFEKMFPTMDLRKDGNGQYMDAETAKAEAIWDACAEEKDKRIKELEELLYEASVYCPYELVEKIDSALLEESIYEQSGPWDGGHEEFPVDDSGKDQ
jgi:hypothetical protein